MINKYFCFVLDEYDTILEASISVDKRPDTPRDKTKVVSFNLNVTDKAGILSTIDHRGLEHLPPRTRDAMKALTNLYLD